MCVNGKFILNKYDGHEYFVNCGHCEACQQEKANKRALRIRNESSLSGLNSYIVTLDYSNDYIPYIKLSEYKAFVKDWIHNYLTVYRGDKVECFLDHTDFSKVVGLGFNFDSFPDFSTLKFLRCNVHDAGCGFLHDRVGVLWLRDVQLFIKRLRSNFIKIGYKGYFSYFYAGEYGTTTNRPHIHFLCFVERGFDKEFRLLLDKSWPYADLLAPRKTPVGFRCCIELAKNPANYVATYINQRVNVSPLLSAAKPFKFFYHFSNHFGYSSSIFSLSEVLDAYDRGSLSFDFHFTADGVPSVCKVRYPKHVLFRYFPKFKGYRHLSSDEVIELVEKPGSIFFNESLRLSFDEKVELFNLLKRLVSGIPKDLYFRWLNAYPFIWSLYSAESIKSSYDNADSVQDLFYHFFNILSFYEGDVSNLFLDDLFPHLSDFVYLVDPNSFPYVLARHQKLLFQYYNYFKHHQIKSLVYEK